MNHRLLALVVAVAVGVGCVRVSTHTEGAWTKEVVDALQDGRCEDADRHLVQVPSAERLEGWFILQASAAVECALKNPENGPSLLAGAKASLLVGRTVAPDSAGLVIWQGYVATETGDREAATTYFAEARELAHRVLRESEDQWAIATAKEALAELESSTSGQPPIQ